MDDPRKLPLGTSLSLRPLQNTRRAGAAVLLAAAIALLVIAAGCRGAGRNRELPPELPRLLQATVETRAVPAEVRQQKERQRAWEEMQHFYRKRAFAPAWLDGRGPLPRAKELIAALDMATPEGIDPNRYNGAQLARMVEEAGKVEDWSDPAAQRRLVEMDATFTYTFLTLAAHLATGRLQPGTLNTSWYTKPRNVDLDGRLAGALASEDKDAIRQALQTLTPPGEDYRRLRDALARYRGIAARGGWPQVPPGPPLKQGATGPRVAALRQRLAAEGDLPGGGTAGAAAPASGEPAGASAGTGAGAKPAMSGAASEATGGARAGADAHFDGAVAKAVAHFQRRHGLDPTGVVDADTLEAMNVPVEERVRQIAANMERWRWMPSSLGERYVWVNVPEFEMKVMEGGREALAMRVVVGKSQSQTPVFSDQMTYIELNPAWNLPDSIVRNEVVPALASDSSYLARKDMELVRGGGEGGEVVDASAVDLASLGRPGSPYHLRQRPGPDNPLGRIKFMFPNQFDVYLHDTPADHLFSREERDFSHGCVRIEYPVKLAQYLLQGDPRWQGPALEQALASGERQTITLPKPLPVHILYWTAWVDPDGTMQFRKDIYGHDAKLEKALAAEPPIRVDFDAARGQQRADLAPADRRRG